MTHLRAAGRLFTIVSLVLGTGAVTLASHSKKSHESSQSRPPIQITIEDIGTDAGKDASVPPAAPSSSDAAVDIAMRYRGYPYVHGGSSSRGFDCSGFVRYVYSRLGLGLPGSPQAQYLKGQPVRLSELKPGDVLFFHTYRAGVSHVGIYIGNNRFIHAANPRRGVVINELTGYYMDRFVGARRFK